MKILITGAFGQLGEILSEKLNNFNEVIKTGRKLPNGENGMSLDICNKIILKDILQISKPDILINLAALTNVDLCEKKPTLARQVNVVGVENICDVFPGRIIHISTDYVFDGKEGPYKESNRTFPISVYGKTKLESEKIILNHNSKNLIIRTNVIYGYRKNTKASFLNWVVESLNKKNKIDVVNDQYNNPTYSKSIANVICLCIINNIYGLYHWGDGEILNRYSFALKIAKKFNLNEKLINPVSTADLNQVAKRPLNSGLISEKLKNILNVEAPSIDECLDDIKETF